MIIGVRWMLKLAYSGLLNVLLLLKYWWDIYKGAWTISHHIECRLCARSTKRFFSCVMFFRLNIWSTSNVGGFANLRAPPILCEMVLAHVWEKQHNWLRQPFIMQCLCAKLRFLVQSLTKTHTTNAHVLRCTGYEGVYLQFMAVICSTGYVRCMDRLWKCSAYSVWFNICRLWWSPCSTAAHQSYREVQTRPDYALAILCLLVKGKQSALLCVWTCVYMNSFLGETVEKCTWCNTPLHVESWLVMIITSVSIAIPVGWILSK